MLGAAGFQSSLRGDHVGLEWGAGGVLSGFGGKKGGNGCESWIYQGFRRMISEA